MNLRQKTVDAVRILSAEAIQRANSGHPGLPLGSAPIGVTLFYDFLKFSPENPRFENRDRFILSAGHGSMLNYALLYLFGYDLTKEDLMNFRQFGSKTPGHPEYGQTPGIETTTGPLGQGIANAVGMAIAESYLAARFNRENFPVVDHYTYALVGDGCLQEGIENEAASLAGTLKLGKLIVFYDDNDITIEGNTDIAFREDVGKRHEALGWQVIKVADANDLNALRRAVKRAKAEPEKPSLIICKSVIGYGSQAAKAATARPSARTICKRPRTISAGRRRPSRSPPNCSQSGAAPSAAADRRSEATRRSWTRTGRSIPRCMRNSARLWKTESRISRRTPSFGRSTRRTRRAARAAPS